MNSDKKTIMFDARVVIRGIEHGIARHVKELLFGLEKNTLHEKYNFIIIINKNSSLLDHIFPRNFRFITLNYGILNILGQFEIFFIILKYKPNIFHTPHFMVPLLSTVPLVVTIHDMNHVALSENYSFIQKIYYNFFLKRKLLKAKSIITVSNFSKTEIVKYLNISPDKIHVFYNGVFKNFQPLDQFDKVKINSIIFKYRLPSKFIFSIGNHKPHKNLEMLTEAYCKGNFNIPLVILTNSNHKLIKIAKYYGKLKLVHFLDFVLEEDISLIYSLSSAFVYISLYEGFGLPAIEAAACAVPVVVSNTTSLPEIMEDAAIYVDPENIIEIQNGIQEALDVHSEKTQLCIKNGLKLIEKYSWEKMANETLQLYNSLL